MNRAWTVVRKEWAEVFKNRFVLFTVAFLPLVLTAIPLVVLFAAGLAGDFSELSDQNLPAGLRSMCGGLTDVECGQYFMVSQFMLLFMLLPLAIPITFASYSIIGEKTARTLEPVLATPITTVELLTGKALAAVIPAIVATWLAFGIFVGGASQLTTPAVLGRILGPMWLGAILVVGPLLSLAAVSVAVMVSSRANDPRVAEQMSMFVILPLLLLFFGQIAGLVFLDQTLVLYMAAGLVVIDVVLLGLAVQFFQRETILTRWK